jgi:hypothetical protein
MSKLFQSALLQKSFTGIILLGGPNCGAIFRTLRRPDEPDFQIAARVTNRRE